MCPHLLCAYRAANVQPDYQIYAKEMKPVGGKRPHYAPGRKKPEPRNYHNPSLVAPPPLDMSAGTKIRRTGVNAKYPNAVPFVNPNTNISTGKSSSDAAGAAAKVISKFTPLTTVVPTSFNFSKKDEEEYDKDMNLQLQQLLA